MRDETPILDRLVLIRRTPGKVATVKRLLFGRRPVCEACSATMNDIGECRLADTLEGPFLLCTGCNPAKPPEYIPTPEQVAASCLAIQAEWSPKERYWRSRGILPCDPHPVFRPLRLRRAG